MTKTFNCVAVALLLAGTSAWAQSGVYTKQFRVSPHAPTAPNPFSRPATHQSQPPFGKPTPQRFSASPFPDANRNVGIFIRNRIVTRPRHGHVGTTPANIYVPWLPSQPAYSIDPYDYNLLGTDLATCRACRLSN